MDQLKTISAMVRRILTDDVASRNSDIRLYLLIAEQYAEKKNLNLRRMTVESFFIRLANHEFPAFETVRRSRQKVQETTPELAASDRVKKCRTKQEETFRSFARGEA